MDESASSSSATTAEVAALKARVAELEDVLRYLASYVGNGGYNAPEVDPEQFQTKILDGIDRLVEQAKP